MDDAQKFLFCEICGNLMGFINSSGVTPECCGEPMIKLIPNSTDASGEKHVPAVTVTGNTINVQIGSAPNPMEDAHFIDFVFVETSQGGQRKRLIVGDPPTATFSFTDDLPRAVFAYCNLHGLWRYDLD